MVYKLILFRDGRSILCSDEKPKESDRFYNILSQQIFDQEYNNPTTDNDNKIIAGISDTYQISMSDEIRQELQDKYGWVNWKHHFDLDNTKFGAIAHSYYLGFKKCQELRGFSLRDIEDAYQKGFDDCLDGKHLLQTYKQFLEQPIEVNVELEVEDNFTENGEFGITDYGVKDKYYTVGKQPKINPINNSVIINKLL
jgi:hypothetical protein